MCFKLLHTSEFFLSFFFLVANGEFLYLFILDKVACSASPWPGVDLWFLLVSPHELCTPRDMLYDQHKPWQSHPPVGLTEWSPALYLPCFWWYGSVLLGFLMALLHMCI